MDNEEILGEYFNIIGYAKASSIQVSDSCNEEMLEILSLHTGQEGSILGKFLTQVQVMAHQDRSRVVEFDGNEILKRAGGLVSLHLKGKGFNIRILVAYYNYNPILLKAFEEKENGTSRMDKGYAVNIAEALSRLEKFKKEDY